LKCSSSTATDLVALEAISAVAAGETPEELEPETATGTRTPRGELTMRTSELRVVLTVENHDAWALEGEGPGQTWTVDNPAASAEIDQIIRQPEHRRRLDCILVSSWHAHPDASARVRRASLVFNEPTDSVRLSDHFAVLAEIEVFADRTGLQDGGET